jgi:hypothetical protein
LELKGLKGVNKDWFIDLFAKTDSLAILNLKSKRRPGLKEDFLVVLD